MMWSVLCHGKTMPIINLESNFFGCSQCSYDIVSKIVFYCIYWLRTVIPCLQVSCSNLSAIHHVKQLNIKLCFAWYVETPILMCKYSTEPWCLRTSLFHAPCPMTFNKDVSERLLDWDCAVDSERGAGANATWGVSGPHFLPNTVWTLYAVLLIVCFVIKQQQQQQHTKAGSAITQDMQGSFSLHTAVWFVSSVVVDIHMSDSWSLINID